MRLDNAIAAAAAVRYNPQSGRLRTRFPRVEEDGKGNFFVDGQAATRAQAEEITGYTYKVKSPYQDNPGCFLCFVGVPDIHAATHAAATKFGL